MIKKLIISIISVLIVGGGIGYFFWSKDIKAQEEEKVRTQELTYQSTLAETLELIETSTTDSAVLASTYQKYWGKIINGSIPFSTLSEGLNVDKSILSDMTNSFQRAYFSGELGAGLKQGEFNTMISMVKFAKVEDTNVILEQQVSITEAISNLKNPSEKFKDNYESLLEVYEIYDTFVSISTSPVGSYVEYSKNINSTYENLSSKIKTVKLQLE